MHAILYADGSFRFDGVKSIGQTGWVATVLTEPPLIVTGGSGAKPSIKSSEEAEWRAVFDGLSWLACIKSIDAVTIRSDLKDLCAAINGTGGSAKSLGYAKSLRAAYPHLDIHAGWVPREHNTLADRLSKSGRQKGEM